MDTKNAEDKPYTRQILIEQDNSESFLVKFEISSNPTKIAGIIYALENVAFISSQSDLFAVRSRGTNICSVEPLESRVNLFLARYETLNRQR